MARPSLSQSFMWLCFATAFILVSFQLRPSSGKTGDAAALSDELTDQNRIMLDLSDRKVYIYHANALQTTYDVAVGKDGWETPVGNHKIITKKLNPNWQNPFTGEVLSASPENPLGSRWIGFWTDSKHEVGFHGTNEEDLMGQAVSHGCVRMRNQDIEALFNEVRLGTLVVVQP